MSPDALLASVRQAIDEVEWWARNAGGRTDGAPPETGEHWHWETCEGDRPVRPDPTLGADLTDEEGEVPSVSLRSVEEYQTSSVGPLPSFIIGNAEEVNAVAAGHIVRHDPASVLRRIAAGRRVLERHEPIHDHGRHSERECPPYCDGVHDRPTVCGTCRDLPGDLIEAPCDELVDLARGYGIEIEVDSAT